MQWFLRLRRIASFLKNRLVVRSTTALACGPTSRLDPRMSIPCVTSGIRASPSGRPMDKVLLDSDILIDHLRGYEPARQYLKRFETGEVQGYLSIITVAELAAGQMRQEAEATKVQHLLALFTLIDLDYAIAWRG